MERCKNEKLNNLYLALQDLYGDYVMCDDIGTDQEALQLLVKLINNDGRNPKYIWETVWFLPPSDISKYPEMYANLHQPEELKEKLNPGWSIWAHECDEDFY